MKSVLISFKNYTVDTMKLLQLELMACNENKTAIGSNKKVHVSFSRPKAQRKSNPHFEIMQRVYDCGCCGKINMWAG